MPERMRSGRVLMLLIGVAAVGMLLIAGGCGKKGPPIPPREVPPPRIEDLRHTLEGDTLKLFWSIPEKPKKGAEISGFVVFRSKRPLSEEPCGECPLIFERRAEIAFEEKEAKGLVYDETIAQGYRYTYRVTVFTHRSSRGRDSNLVEFDY